MAIQQILNAEQQKYANLTKTIQNRQIKLTMSKRDVTIHFKDETFCHNRIKIIEGVDLTTSSDGLYTLFIENENIIYKYPIENIDSIEEKLVE